jgi:gluconate 2-dehydrogenase gamma chain
MDEVKRRDLLKTIGLGALALGTACKNEDTREQAASVGATPRPSGLSPAEPHAYTYLDASEVAFLEAAVARLVPEDATGPGALKAGCVHFIDRQLAGGYGSGAKWYMHGPWGESAPEQDYQLPLSPAQLYRVSIENVDAYCKTEHGNVFAKLEGALQDSILHAMERGGLSFSGPSPRAFFEMLLANTMEGFFSDPIYGGNREKTGWRLIGYPGVAAVYLHLVDAQNKPYTAEPVGIGDIVAGLAPVDAHGHPLHGPPGPEHQH